MQKVLDKWAFSPRISSRENNEMERFVQFPPKGYGTLSKRSKNAQPQNEILCSKGDWGHSPQQAVCGDG